MSRIGNNPVSLPEGVTFEVNDSIVTVKGKIGELTQEIKDINIKVEDGFLNITAKREDFSGKLYTSARIHTQDKYEFKYGRIEMRAKLPNWEGMWPAFWMMGANYDTLGWPFCGELDILEHGDYVKSSTIDDPGLISSAVHYGPSDHKSQYATIPNTIYFDTGQENFVRAETTIENPFEDFHTYSLQWAPDKLEFYVALILN